MMVVNSGKTALREEFFEERWSGALGVEGEDAEACIEVFWVGRWSWGIMLGREGMGVDLPTWPEDLMVEVVR